MRRETFARQVTAVGLAVLVAATSTALVNGYKAEAAELDIVLAAAKAEGQAARKQATLNYKVGDTRVLYSIERELPDRVRIVVQSGGQTREIVGIGSTVYLRGTSGWQASMQVPMPSEPFSLADLLGERFRNVRELAPPGPGEGQRGFEGHIDWIPAGGAGIRNQGTLAVFLDRPSGRLSRLEFSGQCGDVPCTFVYSLTYNENVTIQAPK